MRKCVLRKSGRCASLAVGEDAQFEKHPFLRGRFWCQRCAAAYHTSPCPIAGAEEPVYTWPADEHGTGCFCSICGCGGKEVLGCDGPCQGYFVTCQSCAENVVGYAPHEVEACMEDEASKFYCVFCRPGGKHALRSDAYEWLRHQRIFAKDTRKRAKLMKRHSRSRRGWETAAVD